jgi:AraC-like DNA-binding protein
LEIIDGGCANVLNKCDRPPRSVSAVANGVDTDGGAILHPQRAPFRVDRFTPSEHVGRFVEHYWLVRWQLDDGEQHRQLVLSHPTVNMSISGETHRVVGPTTGVVERWLAGSGWTFGVMFRPAGFWPLLGRPLASIADKELALADVLPAAEAIAKAGNLAARQNDGAVMDAALAPLFPSSTVASEATTQLAELARNDRRIVRVEQLAQAAELSPRTLERRFSTHVGLSPKKVIRRYRLQEVAERARTADVDWASIAAELGYADQAHLIRDFRAVTGEAPAKYSRAMS